MLIDVHVYSLPERLRDPMADLPAGEPARERIHRHPEGELALSLSSPERITRSMDQSGIHQSVLVSLPWTDQALCRETNDHVLDAAAGSDRFMALCAVNPARPGWRAEAERVLEAGALGLKVNPQWQGFRLDGPEADELARWLCERSAPLMVHTDQAYRESAASPAQLYHFITAHPELEIVAAHLGGLLGLYALHEPMRKAFDNVWFDTAVSSTPEMVAFYVQAGLGHRLLFGSDHPFNHCHDQAAVVSGIRGLGLGSDVLAALFNDNTQRLLSRARRGRS